MPLSGGVINPAGAFGLPLSGTNIGGAVVMSDDGVFLSLINNSAGVRTYGDVVVVDVTGLLATTTTTANSLQVIGVVSQYGGSGAGTFAVGTPMLVQIRGIARVNIGTNTVAVNDILTSFTTAGQAATNNALTAPTVNAGIAVALEANAAKDTNNTIRCKLII